MFQNIIFSGFFVKESFRRRDEEIKQNFLDGNLEEKDCRLEISLSPLELPKKTVITTT